MTYAIVAMSIIAAIALVAWAIGEMRKHYESRGDDDNEL